MYGDFETETSHKYLQTVIRALNEPICILGGWAVFYQVNKNFKEAQARDYLGSRDIDLGFHMDKTWSEKKLKESPLAKSLDILRRELGFNSVSFRLYKELDTETGEVVRKGKVVPSYQRFMMYVDPIVDFIPPNFKNLFGFNPIDEPLLKLVFENHEHRTELEEFDKKLLLPNSEILVATKINSIHGRDKKDKKLKDLCDLFALLWYSDEKHTNIKIKVKKILSKNDIKEKLSIITDEEIQAISPLVGHTEDEIKRVVVDWDVA